MGMKHYTPKEWAELTPAQISALIPRTPKQAMDAGMPSVAARLAAPATGDFLSPDFGWICGGCARSSSEYPGVVGYISFDLHKCGGVPR